MPVSRTGTGPPGGTADTPLDGRQRTRRRDARCARGRVPPGHPADARPSRRGRRGPPTGGSPPATPVRPANTTVTATPMTTPATPPRNDSSSDSTRNWSRTSRRRAPSARRTPTSARRSSTVMTIVFATPMPPTSSATPPMPTSSPVKESSVAFFAARASDGRLTPTSCGDPGLIARASTSRRPRRPERGRRGSTRRSGAPSKPSDAAVLGGTNTWASRSSASAIGGQAVPTTCTQRPPRARRGSPLGRGRSRALRRQWPRARPGRARPTRPPSQRPDCTEPHRAPRGRRPPPPSRRCPSSPGFSARTGCGRRGHPRPSRRRRRTRRRPGAAPTRAPSVAAGASR